jgi:hypothetical protein
MAWYNEDIPETLNFMVVGDLHCGCDLLQSCLSAHSRIVCHGEVLHEEESIRRQAHEQYFGDSGSAPDWYLPTHISMEQYLTNKIFDNTLFKESAVGVKVGYRHFIDQDLWDYTIYKCRQGDFCLLHVKRNPVACLVELLESRENLTGLNGLTPTCSAVTVDLPLLVSFVRKHVAASLKIDRLCEDRAVIMYHDLILDCRGTLECLFKYLGITYEPECIPLSQQIQQKDICSRVSNWSSLLQEAPDDVRALLEDPKLF